MVALIQSARLVQGPRLTVISGLDIKIQCFCYQDGYGMESSSLSCGRGDTFWLLKLSSFYNSKCAQRKLWGDCSLSVLFSLQIWSLENFCSLCLWTTTRSNPCWECFDFDLQLFLWSRPPRLAPASAPNLEYGLRLFLSGVFWKKDATTISFERSWKHNEWQLAKWLT